MSASCRREAKGGTASAYPTKPLISRSPASAIPATSSAAWSEIVGQFSERRTNRERKVRCKNTSASSQFAKRRGFLPLNAADPVGCLLRTLTRGQQVDLTRGEKAVLAQIRVLYYNAAKREQQVNALMGLWPPTHYQTYRAAFAGLVAKQLISDKGAQLFKITDAWAESHGDRSLSTCNAGSWRSARPSSNQTWPSRRSLQAGVAAPAHLGW